MPKSRASPDQVETYLSQERSKRREMLQKFLDHCRNFQVIKHLHKFLGNWVQVWVANIYTLQFALAVCIPNLKNRLSIL
jgi:hypothetical protein